MKDIGSAKWWRETCRQRAIEKIKAQPFFNPRLPRLYAVAEGVLQGPDKYHESPCQRREPGHPGSAYQ